MENQNPIQEPKKETRFFITTATGENLKLDKATVIKYIAGGQPISDQEFIMFYQLCKTYQVNPFIKEAYLVKYNNSPATIIVDYKVLQKIAENNPHYRGMKHGIIAVNENGEEIRRVGAYILPGEKIVGGWCDVYRDDNQEPTSVVASFAEFGQKNKVWNEKPCFMIVKVAKAQALREAFPNAIQANVYTKDEMPEPPAKQPQATQPMSAPNMSALDATITEEGVIEEKKPIFTQEEADEDF